MIVQLETRLAKCCSVMIVLCKALLWVLHNSGYCILDELWASVCAIPVQKHDSSDSMLCLYCLRVFHVKFVAQGWGQTQTYYHHLLRHQSKTSNRKCTFCKLSFFNAQDMKQHRKTNHQPNQKGVIGETIWNNPHQHLMLAHTQNIQTEQTLETSATLTNTL